MLKNLDSRGIGSFIEALQITIDDGLYMVMPLLAVQKSQIGSVGFQTLDESNAALLVSLETTSIAVCSSGSLVSKGKFKGFCVRFIEDFDASIDAWRPHSTEKLRPINAAAPSHGQQNIVNAGKMSSAGISQLNLAFSFDPSNINMCYVRSGTYDICSKTSLDAQVGSAQWFLNISWQMEGLDISLNTRMGRLCSLLTSTFTSFVAENYADDISDSISSSANINKLNISTPITANTAVNADYEDDTITNLPNFERNICRASKAQLAIQMRRQSKILSEMIRRGASEADIETERRKLQRYEAALYADFKQDLSDKIRYQSQKATTTFKDSIGWTGGSRASDIGEQKKKRTQRRLKTGDDSTVTDRQSSIADDISKAKLLSSSSRTSSVDFPSFLTKSRMTSDDKMVKYSPRIDAKKDVLSKKVSETSSQSRSAPLTPIRQHRGGAPSVDLYLDLKIYVDNGQCTFRSSSTGKPEQNSPKQSYRNRILNPLITTLTRVISNDIAATQTVIPLPGLNVKSYYASKNSSEKKISVQTLKFSGLPDDVINQMTSSIKRGQFYLCLSLERMPAETVIGTHILDFIEQTLEPISNFGSPGTKSSSSALGVGVAEAKAMKQCQGDHTSETVISVDQSETVYTMSSFPVDVIIYMNIQSSNLRFVSQPHSMIECLLRLPQLKLVATSRKADSAIVPASSKSNYPKNRPEPEKCSENSLSGGISITILLNDFCLFVYHPYQTLVTNRPNIGLPAASCAKDSSAGTQHSTSSDRRDALSLSIKEIIVDITRSQNVCTIGSPTLNSPVSKTAQGNAGSGSRMKNSVRFSLLVDVGDAKFKHDIRHLNEVLCFVKAWYRNAIFRRLFLGEVIVEPSSLNFSTSHSRSYAKSPSMKRGNSSSSTSSQTPSITSSLLYDNDEENFFSTVHDHEKQGTKVGDISKR
uniref:Fragile site-associated protein C-terminal domain-containing protein n=1 Tax=Romanomermis culicivorax TaxID=13658 RepID=A0A915K7L7_ROMCU